MRKYIRKEYGSVPLIPLHVQRVYPMNQFRPNTCVKYQTIRNQYLLIKVHRACWQCLQLRQRNTGVRDRVLGLLRYTQLSYNMLCILLI